MKRNSLAFGCAIASATAVLSYGSPGWPQEGVTRDSIKVGNIVPYSGLASAYGNIGEARPASR